MNHNGGDSKELKQNQAINKISIQRKFHHSDNPNSDFRLSEAQ